MSISRERLEQWLATERAELARCQQRDEAMRKSGTRSTYHDDQLSRVRLLLELLAECDNQPGVKS